MTVLFENALILLVLLQVKHMFADFFLQTARMLAGRSVYLHFGRAQHAGLHALLSAFALLIVGSPIVFVIWLCVLEGLLHYHIDYAKGRYSEKAGHGPMDRSYWFAFGVDQALHQLTYVGMVWIWLQYTA